MNSFRNTLFGSKGCHATPSVTRSKATRFLVKREAGDGAVIVSVLVSFFLIFIHRYFSYLMTYEVLLFKMHPRSEGTFVFLDLH